MLIKLINCFFCQTWTCYEVPSQYSSNNYGVDTGYDWWSITLTTDCEIINVNLSNAFIIDADNSTLRLSQRPEQVNQDIVVEFDFNSNSSCPIRFKLYYNVQLNYFYVFSFVVLISPRKLVLPFCPNSTKSLNILKITHLTSVWAGMEPPGRYLTSLIKWPRQH